MSDEKGLSRREFFSFFRRLPEQAAAQAEPVAPERWAPLELPLPQRRQLAYAVVDWERCVTYKGEPCDLCLKVCPVPLVMSVDTHGHPRVDFDRCTGCGACEAACPVQPTAINLTDPP